MPRLHRKVAHARLIDDGIAGAAHAAAADNVLKPQAAPGPQMALTALFAAPAKRIRIERLPPAAVDPAHDMCMRHHCRLPGDRRCARHLSRSALHLECFYCGRLLRFSSKDRRGTRSAPTGQSEVCRRSIHRAQIIAVIDKIPHRTGRSSRYRNTPPSVLRACS